MNCHPYDIARIICDIDGVPGMRDKIVQVTRLMPGPGDYWELREMMLMRVDRLVFFGTPPRPVTAGGYIKIDALADKVLRPIRDQPGEDEILRIAGRPHYDTARV